MSIRQTILIGAVIVAVGLIAVPALAIDAATQAHINELQAQIDALEAQRLLIKNSLTATQEQKQTLQRDINLLQGQINNLQVQVDITGKKIDLTGAQIADTTEKITKTQQNIEQKQSTIGRMVLFLEQRDHEDPVASLLKYANLSSFLRQFHDLAQVQDHLVATVSDLRELKGEFRNSQEDLQEQQDELEAYNEQVLQQQQQISGVKNQKAKVLKDTKGQEAVYQQQLTAIEKKQAAFFKEQQQLEAQVIAGGLYIVHVTAPSVPPAGTKLFRNPEDAPHLTQSYGYTQYARRGAYGGLIHNGLDLASGYGTPIHAAADGTIVAHGTNDGWGNWVAIQHPNNLVTIYGHMSRFENLPVGTPVVTSQAIGYEGNTGNVTGPHVHFSVYREFFTFINQKNGQLYFNYDQTLNPASYM